ncbi:response regulator [Floridanema aerugineum]|jgi:two-component system sensor histidine kinase/response regulator|uniref:histidine kinase n=1 Tax=Floridaenema aerugineum BLCC-F46 TaxID=3153654 RepID=A0ABV4X722_9CYAN
MNTSQPFSADLLLVDDTPDNLRLLSVMLTENGYKTRKVINGERALQAVEVVTPDLILLDINMPDMNGYEVCHRLKKIDKTRDIPVIFISALDDVFDKVKAFQAGGVDYITKPFQVEEVLARVNTHLNIRKLQKQLQQQNSQLQEEIRHRLSAQEANAQLKALETQLRQQLNVFLHAVSHDLRNPVIGTKMVLNNLTNQVGETIQLPRKVLERMQESNERQLGLINSLIETHAAEVWGLKLNYQTLELKSLVESALIDLQPMLDKEQVVLRLLISPNLPLIKADSLHLVRVYQNLIGNALKHNPPGFSLTLDAQVENGWLRCTVADNGVGISKEQCDKIFDLYFQGKQKRQSVGLGLGLYLCYHIIQAHGGTIGVESELGSGTTFWFILPLDPEMLNVQEIS